MFMRREKLANAFAFGVAALSALSSLLAALLFLSGGAGTSTPRLELLASFIPYIQFTVRLDALGAFFLLIVSLLGFALTTYSLGYAKGFFGRKNVGILGAFYNALLLATTLTFVADTIWLFLIAWELMALTAYCLVSFEHKKRRRAMPVCSSSSCRTLTPAALSSAFCCCSRPRATTVLPVCMTLA